MIFVHRIHSAFATLQGLSLFDVRSALAIDSTISSTKQYICKLFCAHVHLSRTPWIFRNKHHLDNPDGRFLMSHMLEATALRHQLISQSYLSAHQHLDKFSTNRCSALSLLLTIVRSKRLQLDCQSGLSACIVIEIKIWGQLWLP